MKPINFIYFIGPSSFISSYSTLSIHDCYLCLIGFSFSFIVLLSFVVLFSFVVLLDA